MCEIPKECIEKFKDWNICGIKKDSLEYDKKLVQAVLLMFVDKGDLTKFKIEEELINFSYGKNFF